LGDLNSRAGSPPSTEDTKDRKAGMRLFFTASSLQIWPGLLPPGYYPAIQVSLLVTDSFVAARSLLVVHDDLDGPRASMTRKCRWSGCHRAYFAIKMVVHRKAEQAEYTQQWLSTVYMVGRCYGGALWDLFGIFNGFQDAAREIELTLKVLYNVALSGQPKSPVLDIESEC